MERASSALVELANFLGSRLIGEEGIQAAALEPSFDPETSDEVRNLDESIFAAAPAHTICQSLDTTRSTLQAYITSSNNASDNIFQSIVAEGVTIRLLLSIVGHLMCTRRFAPRTSNGPLSVSPAAMQRIQISAARLYLTLLALPGAGAFGIHSNTLVRRFITVLKNFSRPLLSSYSVGNDEVDEDLQQDEGEEQDMMAMDDGEEGASENASQRSKKRKGKEAAQIGKAARRGAAASAKPRSGAASSSSSNSEAVEEARKAEEASFESLLFCLREIRSLWGKNSAASASAAQSSFLSTIEITSYLVDTLGHLLRLPSSLQTQILGLEASSISFEDDVQGSSAGGGCRKKTATAAASKKKAKPSSKEAAPQRASTRIRDKASAQISDSEDSEDIDSSSDQEMGESSGPRAAAAAASSASAPASAPIVKSIQCTLSAACFAVIRLLMDPRKFTAAQRNRPAAPAAPAQSAASPAAAAAGSSTSAKTPSSSKPIPQPSSFFGSVAMHTMQSLLPALLMDTEGVQQQASSGSGNTTSSKQHMAHVRDECLSFIKSVLTTLTSISLSEFGSEEGQQQQQQQKGKGRRRSSVGASRVSVGPGSIPAPPPHPSSEVLDAVITLLQHMAFNGQHDRSDSRSSTAEGIAHLWTHTASLSHSLIQKQLEQQSAPTSSSPLLLPLQHVRSELITFLIQLSRNPKAGARLFAVECGQGLIEHAVKLVLDRTGGGDSAAAAADQDDGDVDWNKLWKDSICSQIADLFGAIISRCSDKIASVRGKALQSVASILQNQMESSKTFDFVECLETFGSRGLSRAPVSSPLASPISPMNNPDDEDNDSESAAVPAAASASLSALDQSSINMSHVNLSGISLAITPSSSNRGGSADAVQMLLQMVERRVDDEKPGVRRTALMALEALVRLRPALFLKSSSPAVPSVSFAASSPQSPRFASSASASSAHIEVFLRHVRDSSVANRKQALSSLSSLISHAIQGLNSQEDEDQDREADDEQEDAMQDADASFTLPSAASAASLLISSPEIDAGSRCLACVLTCASDLEATVVERCLDCVDTCIIQVLALSTVAKKSASSSATNASNKRLQNRVWALLEGMGPDHMSDFQTIVRGLAKAKRLPAALGAAIIAKIPADSSRALRSACILLEEFASVHPSKVDASVPISFYKHAFSQAVTSSSTGSVIDLSVASKLLCCVNAVAHCAEVLDQDRVSALSTDILSKLHTFAAPPLLISTLIKAMARLCPKSQPGSAGTWWNATLDSCQKHLEDYVTNGKVTRAEEEQIQGSSPLSSDEEMLSRYLYTLGDLSLICGAKVTPRAMTLLQSFTSKTLSLSSAAASSSSSSSAPSTKITSNVRGHAFVALGKVCLADEALAKRSMHLFVQELTTANRSDQDLQSAAADPVVRNNVLVCLADLCVKYTSLIDPHVNSMAACLRDPCPLVRHHTLTLLTQLLAEEFIKFRNTLFYAYLPCLVDRNSDVRGFAEYALMNVLHSKYPNAVSNHFVESIFVLNNFTAHPEYNQFAASSADRKRSAIPGDSVQSRSLRHRIYRILLESMTPEHRIKVHTQLMSGIVAAAVEGETPVIPIVPTKVLQGDQSTVEQQLNALSAPGGGDGSHVLMDALDILCMKEARWTLSSSAHANKSKAASSAAAGDEDMGMGDGAEAGGKENALQNKVMSQMERKIVAESVAPIVMDLKRAMESKHSPLLKHLMQYIRHLATEFKDQIQDLFGVDRQLLKELEYDMRRGQQYVIPLPAPDFSSLYASVSSPLPAVPAPRVGFAAAATASSSVAASASASLRTPAREGAGSSAAAVAAVALEMASRTTPFATPRLRQNRPSGGFPVPNGFTSPTLAQAALAQAAATPSAVRLLSASKQSSSLSSALANVAIADDSTDDEEQDLEQVEIVQAVGQDGQQLLFSPKGLSATPKITEPSGSAPNGDDFLLSNSQAASSQASRRPQRAAASRTREAAANGQWNVVSPRSKN